MIRQNKLVFDEFKKTHDNYCTNPKTYKDQFNEEGEKIQMIIRRYENQLCRHSENGGFGKFTGNLSDKFWEGVRSLFPKIDEVGVQ